MEILLSGPDWKFRDFLPGKAQGSELAAPGYDWSAWPNATVPGSAQLDLLRNGALEDVYLDLASRDAEWVSARQWVYVKRFSLGEELSASRIILRFEGIDYSGSIYFNSEPLGECENLFVPCEFDVTDRIHNSGENTVMVILDPAPVEQAQFGRTSLVRTFKPRMNYGWDFAARCVPVGIWQDVKLIVTGPARITDCWAHTTLSDDFRSGSIDLFTSLACSERRKLVLEASISFGEQVVAETSTVLDAAAGEGRHVTAFALDSPALWWPNGSGEQPLYKARVVVRDSETGEISDERSVSFGFKRVRLKSNPGMPDGLRPWCFEVNGVPTFIKGWNWVPVDELYGGRYDDRIDRLLRLAAEAHVNLLRVWGGGIIEQRRFYETCDRLGIMVWQEFPLTGSGGDCVPATDDEFLGELRRMAEAVVPSRRNCACHAVWCGGNELKWTGGEDPAMRVMHEVCDALDPEKPFVPTSPLWTGAADEPVEIDIHGHWWHQGLRDHYTMYNTRVPAFHSEFGAEGAANFENVERFIHNSKLWPVSRRNPIYRHRGEDWLREDTMREFFGEIDNALHYYSLSQFLQWEGLRYVVESGRRRKYECGGTVPWQFNEPWPNLFCTNAVDYYTDPKMAYYAVSEAYAPVHVSARYDCLTIEPGDTFRAKCFVNNSHRAAASCRLDWSIYALDGAWMAEGEATLDLAPNSVTEAGEVQWEAPGDFADVFVLVLLLTDAPGNVLSRNAYFFSSAAAPPFSRLVDPPETTIKVLGSDLRQTGVGSDLSIELTNTGDCCALFVKAVPTENRHSVYFRSSHITLAPGDRGVIEAFLEKPVSQFVIGGWNTNAEAVP